MNWYFATGDLDFFWKEQLQALKWLPQVFRPDQGFGKSSLLSLWLDYPFRLLLKILSTLGLSWFIIEKFLWLSVFFITIYSSYRLASYVLGKRVYLAPLIYAANTYFLLLFSGGQLGVALAYGFAPFVLYKFIESIDTKKSFAFRPAITHGLILAILIVFDLRIAYLITAGIALYILFQKKFFFFISLGVSLLAAALVHLFWILPTALTRTGPGSLGQEFTNPAVLKFFSFADFSHALSLLHPNWPENLFGKVYFLQPEFLVLPVLAFGSLWFTKNKKVIFFSLLAVAGAFFSKGVNDPFGGIFQWMFIHIPGFVMFRDPTKFYLFTAIGYAILIPYLFQYLNKKILYILFILFWIISIRAVFLGQVKGNFSPLLIPEEYFQLKNLLVADSIPSRTLWIPDNEKFAYSSDVHPIITATSSASISSSVKYVIVPEDLGKRIFLTDYAFDPSLRKKLVVSLSKTRLKPVAAFHDITVFENPDFIGMQNKIPPIVTEQQQLADIGLWASVVSLIILIICIKLFI